MAKYVGYKRPKDTKKTVKHLLSYLGHYKWAFLLIAILVFLSAGAGIMGTFLIKPVVNNFIVPGNMKGLIIAVCGMGVMYACGALSTLGYNRLMVHTSQKVVSEIRMDLFKHTQKLPLKYFDNNTHGEIMSHFTNDVDTVQEAMNNSFAMVIQSFLTLFGTITMMLVCKADYYCCCFSYSYVHLYQIQWYTQQEILSQTAEGTWQYQQLRSGNDGRTEG